MPPTLVRDSLLNIALLIESFVPDKYIFTIVLENRVAAKVKADDSNNNKIPKDN